MLPISFTIEQIDLSILPIDTQGASTQYTHLQPHPHSVLCVCVLCRRTEICMTKSDILEKPSTIKLGSITWWMPFIRCIHINTVFFFSLAMPSICYSFLTDGLVFVFSFSSLSSVSLDQGIWEKWATSLFSSQWTDDEILIVEGQFKTFCRTLIQTICKYIAPPIIVND